MHSQNSVLIVFVELNTPFLGVNHSRMTFKWLFWLATLAKLKIKSVIRFRSKQNSFCFFFFFFFFGAIVCAPVTSAILTFLM